MQEVPPEERLLKQAPRGHLCDSLLTLLKQISDEGVEFAIQLWKSDFPSSQLCEVILADSTYAIPLGTMLNRISGSSVVNENEDLIKCSPINDLSELSYLCSHHL